MASLKGTAFVPWIAAAPFHNFPARVAFCPFGDRWGRLRHALHEGANVHQGKMLLLARLGRSQSTDRENQLNEAHVKFLQKSFEQIALSLIMPPRLKS